MENLYQIASSIAGLINQDEKLTWNLIINILESILASVRSEESKRAIAQLIEELRRLKGESIV